MKKVIILLIATSIYSNSEAQKIDLNTLKCMVFFQSKDSIDMFLRSIDYKYSSSGYGANKIAYSFFENKEHKYKVDGIYAMETNTKDPIPTFTIMTVSNSDEYFYQIKQQCEKDTSIKKVSEVTADGVYKRIYCDPMYKYEFIIKEDKTFKNLYSVMVNFAPLYYLIK
ncbi:MAG TPA: hypothetical protein PK431_11610 [Chitinophagales bacterium]|nr:hypothetical protein [Chitinophagales bacterium]